MQDWNAVTIMHTVDGKKEREREQQQKECVSFDVDFHFVVYFGFDSHSIPETTVALPLPIWIINLPADIYNKKKYKCLRNSHKLNPQCKEPPEIYVELWTQIRYPYLSRWVFGWSDSSTAVIFKNYSKFVYIGSYNTNEPTLKNLYFEKCSSYCSITWVVCASVAV